MVFVQCRESGEEHLQELYDLQPDGSGRIAWAAVEEAFGAKVEIENTGVPGLLQEGFYKGCTLSTFAAGVYLPVVVYKARGATHSLCARLQPCDDKVSSGTTT